MSDMKQALQDDEIRKVSGGTGEENDDRDDDYPDWYDTRSWEEIDSSGDDSVEVSFKPTFG